MAPFAAIDDMPHQPLVDPTGTSSHVVGYLLDSHCCVGANNRLDVVRRHPALEDVVEQKKSPTRTQRRHRRNRRVSFSNDVDIREIPHLQDLPNEEVLATWWNANDYLVIRKMISLTVHMIAKGSMFDPDDADFCERGLEIRTKTGSRKRSLHKLRAIETVLSAQDFQRQEGFSDPEYIAESYTEYTRASGEESYLAGLTDEIAAAAYLADSR